MIVPLSFQGFKVNADGMIAEKDLMNLFRTKINALPKLEETYTEAEQIFANAA